MIVSGELVPIGQFKKPHGIKGEIVFSFTNNSFTTNECPFLICEIEGIFVPFRIDNYRLISDSSAYVHLKNINSDQQASLLTHKKIFFPEKFVKADIGNDSLTWDFFIGFTLTDKRLGKIGRIVEVDKTTINTLFIVEKDNEEILIPAVEEFIIRIDEDHEELLVKLPEGLVE